MVLSSWLLFCGAAAVDYGRQGRWPAVFAFITLGAVPIALGKIVFLFRHPWWPSLRRLLDKHTEWLDSLPTRTLGFWIALAAGSGLYFELVLIRYQGTCFAIFGFFKNLSLLSCFLGLGIGYALGRVKPVLTPLAVPLISVELIVMHALGYADVSTTMQNPISEQWAMGFNFVTGFTHNLLVYSFLIWAFAFNALCLIPLGQLASYLMGRGEKLHAYNWNLLGSIVAVLVFCGLSFLWSPPVIWCAVGLIAISPFLRGMLAPTFAIAAVALGVVGTSFLVVGWNIYSPYQILTVIPHSDGTTMVMVNHFSYQVILDLSENGPGIDHQRPTLLEEQYGVPYCFQKSLQDVLVVGAGTGNDVAAALRHGAEHVDAVEIDPVILRLGQMLHPESPYQSTRVTPHVQDAREFFRTTANRYDLIVYGLLDSHTAVSGLSGVRLDSYIYTVEALREARSRLKDGGVLCLSFCLGGRDLGKKLHLMVKEAFDGQDPRIFHIGNATCFLIGPDVQNGPIPPGASELTRFYGLKEINVNSSTDDWPFFYMPARRYPVSYLLMIAMLASVAALFLRPVLKLEAGPTTISWPCFLLGAGFMLLETKAVTELALFYGSTWIVISVVILSILIMALLANLLVMRWPRIPPAVCYPLLLASLVLSLWFSTVSGGIQGQWISQILPPAILTLPMLFSGAIFSTEMRSAQSVSAALGSNLIGGMVGGCLEYNSMYFGYRSLYVLAIAIYASSMIISLRRQSKKPSLPLEIVAVG